MERQKNRRILLIDDQHSIHEDYRKVIGAERSDTSALDEAAAGLFGDQPTSQVESFEIDSAYQGEEGFQMVKLALSQGRPYALAFVDMRMPPGWDGINTIKKIWDVDSEILIVICTAYSDYSWEEMTEQLGQSDRYLILKKPFERVEVRQFASALTERWNIARTDVLTGLLNRRSFSEHLQREHSRAVRYGTTLSCAMLDMDFFKRINDELGHASGDDILRSVAHTLTLNTRASDYLCRFGGEELCVLLPHSDEQQAHTWAEKTRLAIAALEIRGPAGPLNVSVSIGVAALDMSADSPIQLLDHADIALRSAKQRGRNQVVDFSQTHENASEGIESTWLDNPLSGVSAAEVMTTPIPLLPIDASANDAADLFLRCGVSCAPVVDETGILRGVLSQKDIMPQLVSPTGQTKHVRELMRTNVISYREDAAVDRIFDFLSRVTVGQVFIVRDQRPLGAISRNDLLRWIGSWLAKNTAQESPTVYSAETIERAKGRIRQGTEQLLRQATALTNDPMDADAAPMPRLLEVMFKMQELMNDLIACSHKPRPAHDKVSQ